MLFILGISSLQSEWLQEENSSLKVRQTDLTTSKEFSLKSEKRLTLILDVYSQNAEASYDFSSNDPFPYPRYTDDWFNR